MIPALKLEKRAIDGNQACRWLQIVRNQRNRYRSGRRLATVICSDSIILEGQLKRSNETPLAAKPTTDREAGTAWVQYLSVDRDIRELMGARQLYIADVFDVSSDSRRRKPYGRIFSTKGKSLIFYAFDLDQQTRAKNAASFQAWGKSELGASKP